MSLAHRKDPLWIVHIIHRVSGLILVLFLPFHFYVLGLALNDTAELDQFLNWTDSGVVKFAEAGLVGLLGVHLFGGLRILALEFLPWSARQKSYAAMALALSFVASVTFLLRAF
ncbi:MAG: succinate dehydrogenase, cytochrome b556 subunit [Methyloligellaceae bacterium]